MQMPSIPTLPRSLAIPRSWRSFDIPSLFSAIIYPALGVAVFIATLALGRLLLHVAPLAIALALIAAPPLRRNDAAAGEAPAEQAGTLAAR